MVVRAPDDIGPGCAGFVKLSGELPRAAARHRRADDVHRRGGRVWTRGFDRVQTPAVSCPPCLPQQPEPVQSGGGPIVNRFEFTPDLVEPGGQPTLTWNVSNATDVQITTISGPPLALPSPFRSPA